MIHEVDYSMLVNITHIDIWWFIISTLQKWEKFYYIFSSFKYRVQI